MKVLWVTGMLLAGGGGLTAQPLFLEKLPPAVNSTGYDEISPLLTRDGSTLFFTRVGYPEFSHRLVIDGRDISQAGAVIFERELEKAYSAIARREIAQPACSEYNQDVWMATSLQNEFDRVIHPGPPLNDALPNSICSLTPDPNTFVVINQFHPEGGLSEGFSTIRRLEDGSWSFPEPLHIDNYYTFSEGVSLIMSSDGEVLLLALERHDTYGETDLYVSFRVEENHYSEPVNLGKVVNSPYRETGPFLSDDRTTLYFSSNRPGGLGGNDLYYTKRLDDSWLSWSVPRRLRAPINTSADESRPFFHEPSGYLYFTSRRDGSSDIFRAKIREARPREDVYVKGTIVDARTQRPLEAKIRFGAAQSAYFRHEGLAKNGTFRLKVPTGIPYILEAESPGYLTSALRLHFEEPPPAYRDYEVELPLDPLEENGLITLAPIYFERSKAIIRELSYPELDRLAYILQSNPGLHIRIEGHTDNVGRPEDLLRLSEERAEAIRRFLIAKGIAPERIETAGFGASRPVTDNDSEESRALNRRVEIRITRSEG